MAVNSTFTPKASLTDAPTNLKEAIDWVLRVTGKDGKGLNKETECICGLAAAVTDLLQSVQLEYNGYQGESKGAETTQNKGATKEEVTNHLNGLFSLVQGLGGTAVVRTYIDQLAQVLSALVGWSSITKCDKGGSGKCKGSSGNNNPHGKNGSGCTYLQDVKHENKCDKCDCMKWKDPNPSSNEGHHLGRRCTRCSSGGGVLHRCQCSTDGSDTCTAESCKCALAGKCCKCYCKEGCKDKCKKNSLGGDKECICKNAEDSYRSAYPSDSYEKRVSFAVATRIDAKTRWNNVTSSLSRHQCAKILLGSVCLIWSGLTYMYWTGKYAKGSPRWNNHILDGSGLDDGTLSQWLQALGFPREMLNNSGPQNRLDKVIWDGISDKLLLGFAVPSGLSSDAQDSYGNTARGPFAMNFAGLVHTIHRDSFNDQAIVFKNGSSSTSDIDQHKQGALFKLYILSCAYFTGLQKKNTTESTPRTPKTIREILYWLSALPYSPAYPEILQHGKHRLTEVLKKPGETESGTANEQKQLKFFQDKRPKPITVHEYNLFAHFQAVTQYCPLVLIGIQGGLHSPKGTDSTKEAAIHALYANTESHFTYPTVSIQAYNQVVHYIRGLFYQLYFLRKQCAVKVTCGGKWRECRYGKDVVSKGVISWMCLGCNPMEHDRKYRVKKVKEGLKTGNDPLAGALKEVLQKIGEVVVQLGNAQEALERRKGEEIKKVKEKLTEAKGALGKAKQGLEKVNGDGLNGKLEEAKKKLDELTKNGSGDLLGKVDKALGTATGGEDFDQGKNKISEAIDGLHKVLAAVKKGVNDTSELKGVLSDWVTEKFQQAIDQIKDICNSPKCPTCKDHSIKCGKTPTPTVCRTCHQQYMDGTPSPLQAFLEDRLPGFSCEVVRNKDDDQPDYPSAASHLGHCGGSGQCCPLPMGFRNNFQKGSTTDMTGQRLYGILYFFSNENMMQSCVYTLVRVTAALSATTPQVLGDVFGFFRGGVGNPVDGKGDKTGTCNHEKDPKTSTGNDKYFCGWCASGLRDVVKEIEWIPKTGDAPYRDKVGDALINIKGDKGTASVAPKSSAGTTPSSLSTLTKNCQYLSPLTGELYTAVSATFGHVYLQWVLYLSDGLHWGLKSLASEFQQIECRGCRDCDPNKCKKGAHGVTGDAQCGCQSIVSCTGVLPVLYRHGFSYGNPFNLEGYQQEKKDEGDYSITEKNEKTVKHCHEFLESLNKVLEDKQATSQDHPLTNLLSQVGKLQYDIRLPWIFVLTVAWLVAVLYLAFGAIWPLDWTHMRSHCRGLFRKGSLSPWEVLMVGKKKGRGILEYFGKT